MLQANHVIEAFPRALRHRILWRGFAMIAVLMALSVSLDLMKERPNFAKWKPSRGPASMGERERY
jgi:hypothetical protein